MTAPETTREGMTDIARRICATHGIPASALRARITTRKFTDARQEVFAACYATGRFSLPQIGVQFGREYSTVRHNVHAYAARAPDYVWPSRTPVTSAVLRELARGCSTIAAITQATRLKGEVVSGTLARLARSGVVVRQSRRPIVWALAEAA